GANAEAGPPDLSPSDPSYLMTRRADAVGALGHTVTWGGISALQDASGHEIADWQVLSASGADYAHAINAPIPEPATLSLLLTGLAWLSLRGARSALRTWKRPVTGAALCGVILTAHAGSHSALPGGFFAQLREEAWVTVDVAGHRCPLSCYDDDAWFYQSSATADLHPPLTAAVLDPLQPANLASVNSINGIGWMQASLSASVWSTPPPGSLQRHATASATADASAAFGDILRINAEGMADRHGLAHARLQIRSDAFGALDSQPIGSAARERAWVGTEVWLDSFLWQQRMTEGGGMQWVAGPTFQALHYQLDGQQALGYDIRNPVTGGDLVSYIGPSPPGWLTLDVVLPFVFGQPLELQAFGSASADVRVAPPALDVADPAYVFPRHAAGRATLSVQWGGIQSVELDARYPSLRPAASSLVPTAFRVESASGADYLHALAPVPEPATGSLLLIGVLLLARWRKLRETAAADR
ncbi:MAG: PEP-CTERM sorting domain-containing protein, partial [Burkholderiales bacterium]|nr:PEP-CTERM sorting domain-containing protein [Burkholderiales bacterium]